MRAFHTLVAAAALVTLTAACGGGGGSNGGVTPPPTAVFTSLGLSPSTATLTVGGTQQLVATPLDQNNNPIAGVTIGYQSSAPTIASVSASGGLVTAVFTGEATITASGTKDGITKSAAMTVQVRTGTAPGTANVLAGDDLKFNPTSVEVAVGGTVTWTIQSVAHNVTFDPGNGVPGNISTGSNKSESRKFDVAGSFPYTCTLHSGMNGTVVVR